MSLIKLHLPPDGKNRLPKGTYVCKAIGYPEEGIPFTRIVAFKGDEYFEMKTKIEFVSIEYGKTPIDLSHIQIIAPEGLIPTRSELGEDGIVCIMQENTPRCEECGLNLVKRFDIKKQQPYMVCPANRWGLNLCDNIDRHDMDCRRESEKERKQRLENSNENPNWGEKYGLEFKSYAEYLQSDLWKQKKATALSFIGNCCKICRSKKSINVHHISYDRIGKELIEDLSILCRSCHKMVHALVQLDPKQYNIQNCEAKILNMTVSEFFATKQKIKDLPPFGLGQIDIHECDKETTKIVTASWSKLPATEAQNFSLKKFGYKGPSLNKQEAFFKIKELKGESFKTKDQHF